MESFESTEEGRCWNVGPELVDKLDDSEFGDCMQNEVEDGGEWELAIGEGGEQVVTILVVSVQQSL